MYYALFFCIKWLKLILEYFIKAKQKLYNEKDTAYIVKGQKGLF